VAEGLAPVPLLALLKHPLARFGLDAAQARAAARGLELAALRGVRPTTGSAGLGPAVEAARQAMLRRERVHPAIAAITDWPAIAAHVEVVTGALAPLSALYGAADETDLATLVHAHLQAAEAV